MCHSEERSDVCPEPRREESQAMLQILRLRFRMTRMGQSDTYSLDERFRT